MSLIDRHQWLSRNSLRSYPLSERPTADDLWQLPDGLILDLSVAGHLPGGLELSSVTITPRIISATFASGGRTVALAMAVMGDAPMSSISLIPAAPGVGGRLAWGPAILSENWPRELGIHRFSGATLEPRTFVDYGPPPIASIRGPGAPAQGVVELSAQGSLQVSIGQGDDQGDPVTLVGLSLATPQNYASPCEARVTSCDCPETPIHTINGVQGDASGNLTLEIIDSQGQVQAVAERYLVELLIARAANDVCARLPSPDSRGLLPGPDGTYS